MIRQQAVKGLHVDGLLAHNSGAQQCAEAIDAAFRQEALVAGHLAGGGGGAAEVHAAIVTGLGQQRRARTRQPVFAP